MQQTQIEPAFQSRQFLPDAAIARLTERRIADPEFVLEGAARRRRRDRLAPDGRLNILAADHPARRVTKVAEDALAMADRRDYLARIVRVLSSDNVDGLMATMDILEDLLALDGLLREAGGPPLLDGKLLIGSLNRGGLAGTSWELDDPVTGPSPATCQAWRLDGAKLLLRIADDEPGSLKTMLACAQAITEAAALHLPLFLEPLPVKKTDKGFEVIKTKEALARITGVASALGQSSRYLWRNCRIAKATKWWRAQPHCRSCCSAENQREVQRRFSDNWRPPWRPDPTCAAPWSAGMCFIPETKIRSRWPRRLAGSSMIDGP